MVGTFSPVLISAGLLVLAAPPHNWHVLALGALIPLVLRLQQARPLSAAALGWLTGFVMLLGGSPWWTATLMRFAHLEFAGALALGLGLCAWQALAWAVWAGTSKFLVDRFQVHWFLAAPLCFALAETVVPSPFQPHLAITVWRLWPVTQVAELGGPAAVGALLVLGNSVLAEALRSLLQRRTLPPAARWAGLVFLLILGLGTARALSIDRLRQHAPTVRVGIVQPNFGVNRPADRERLTQVQIRALRDATHRLSQKGAELVVWPETAWPHLWDRRLRREFPPGHPWELRGGATVPLLFGALTHSFGSGEVHNSAVMISATGDSLGSYDKIHLVPFAEKIPFEETWPKEAQALRNLHPEWPEITPGRDTKVFGDGALRIGPLICSEDLKPHFVQRVLVRKPNLLVSLVSDAWFGNSAAPEQHLALATFRAIETRRALVRAANTGVSAVIDPIGRVEAATPIVDPNCSSSPFLLLAEVPLMGSVPAVCGLLGTFPYGCLVILVTVTIRTGLSSRERRRREVPEPVSAHRLPPGVGLLQSAEAGGVPTTTRPNDSGRKP